MHWIGLGRGENGPMSNSDRPCACPTLPPPPTSGPVYVSPVLSSADLSPIELDLSGYVAQSDTVAECLSSYGRVLSRAVEWRQSTQAAARQLKSDSAHGGGGAFDFAAEADVIEQDERHIETLFYRYAYAQVSTSSSLCV